MTRRITFWLVLTFLLATGVYGEESHMQKLAPDVFFWQGDHVLRKPANCTWIILKDYVVVVDANFPWAAREIIPEIRKTTNKPVRFVFDTHYHSDHTFGNSVFADAGASVIMSDASAEELKTKGKAAWDGWKETGEHSLIGFRLEYPILTFTDKLAIDDGNHRIELIKVGPGHTRGDAVAYLPKEKILMTGDLCVNWKWGNYIGDPDADYDGWIRILGELAQKDVRTVVPGHGDPGTASTLLGERDYLADMLQQVRAGIRAGKTADQLASEIDLSRHGSFGSKEHAKGMSNANAIRGMYRNLTSSNK
jgi:cyclase